VRGPDAVGRAVADHEGAELPAEVEVGLEGGVDRAAPRVEQRLVADHSARDPGQARLAHELVCEAGQVGVGQARVARADDVEVPRGDRLGVGERDGVTGDDGLAPRVGAEGQQRGGGDEELLVRRRDEREIRPAGEQHGVRVKVDDVRAGGGAELRGLPRELRAHRGTVERVSGCGGQQRDARDEQPEQRSAGEHPRARYLRDRRGCGSFGALAARIAPAAAYSGLRARTW